MRFELKLAVNYFFSKRKSLAKFTAVVAIAGITAGVASLIFAQSLARGVQDEMRDKILANTAHITIFRKDGSEIGNYREIAENLAKIPDIQSISPTTYESAILIGTKTKSYAVLKAVKDQKSRVEGQIEVSIGAELAEEAGLIIGDEAEILVSDNDSAKNATVRIAGIFRTGLYDYDSSWIYLAQEDFAKILNRKTFSPTVLSVAVTDIYRVRETTEAIRQKLNDEFKIVDWQEANQPLFAALSLEKKVSLLIISLIVFVAVLNITTTLAMLVNERKRDIAVLRTCGATTRSLLLIFVLEGLFLGIIGTTLGLLFGLIGCRAANYFQLMKLDATVYSLEFVPLRPVFSDIFSVTTIALLLSLLATIYPALRAAKVKPMENLQNA